MSKIKSPEEILALLSEPMPYKWRVQSFSKKKDSATVVAYIDARDVMDRLDEVVGPHNWQREYKDVKGNLFCGIGIAFSSTEGGELNWTWKYDCGSESNMEAEKGEASDAFKRAAVNFGVGRFLYSLDIIRLKAKEEGGYANVVDDNGKRVWDITTYVNEVVLKKKGIKAPEAKEKPPVKEVKAEKTKSAPAETETESEDIKDSKLYKEMVSFADEVKPMLDDEEVITADEKKQIRAALKKNVEANQLEKVMQILTKTKKMYEERKASKKKKK